MSQETEPTVNSLSPLTSQQVKPPPPPQAGDPMPLPRQEPPPAQEGNVSPNAARVIEEEFQIIVGLIGQDRALEAVLQWLDPVDDKTENLEAELLQNGSLAAILQVIGEQYHAILKDFGNDVGVDMVLSSLGLPLEPENHTMVSTKESYNTDEVGLLPPPSPQAGDPMPQPPQPQAEAGDPIEEELRRIAGLIGKDRALEVVLLLDPENHTKVSTKKSHNTDEVGLTPQPSPQAGDPMPLPRQEPPPAQEGNVSPNAARVIEEEFQIIVGLIGEHKALEVVLQFLDPRDDEMKILEAGLLQNGNLAARLKVIREQYLEILSEFGNDVGVDVVLSCLGLPPLEAENQTTASPKESHNTNDLRRRKIWETEEEAGNDDSIVTEICKIDDPPTLHYLVEKMGPSELQGLEQTWNNVEQHEMKQSGSFPENPSQAEAGFEVELSKALCEDSMEQPKSKGA